MTWTKQHDCDLIIEYFGYELQGPTPHGRWYCIDGENRMYLVPDFTSPDCIWTGQALEVWLQQGNQTRSVAIDGWNQPTYRAILRRDYGRENVAAGQGNRLNEAIAWALWEARGK